MKKLNQITEIFYQYLILGLISFGGPAAHVGYFHKVFVEQKKWLDDTTYAQLLSLSQILPGPGSSQMGFAIGLHRGGLIGALMAFFAFTAPSFLLMYFIAISDVWFSQSPIQQELLSGMVNGLKMLAVIVVADATLSMFRKFCNRKVAIGIAVSTSAFLMVSASLLNQTLVLVSAGVLGMILYNPQSDTPQQLNKMTIKPLSTEDIIQEKGTINWAALTLFFAILAVLSFIPFNNQWMNLFSQFYQAGSLVFGGGHVVLPLLQEVIGDSINHDRFLMGYATAQAVPGPMFSLASFLGAELAPNNQFVGALIASAGIFLPGFLLIIAMHGAWERIASIPKVAGAIWGINAAVVGLLMTALYNPVFISAITQTNNPNIRMAIVLLGFFVLQQFQVKIVWMVLAFIGIGIGLQLIV